MFSTHPQTTATHSVSAPASITTLAFLVAALVASLFFQKVNAEYFALSGLSLIAAFAVALWCGRLPPTDRTLAPLALLFAFWAWIGLATALSPVTFISLGTFWTIAFFPFAALITLMVSGFQRFEIYLISTLMAVVATLAVYACVHFFVFDEPPRATFANKNNLAALQMPMAFYAAVCAATFRRLALKVLFLALTALFVFTIGIIGSRGVLICLIAGIALIFGILLLDRWSRKSLLVLAVTVLAALVASNMAGSGQLAKQTETMLAPSEAGDDRFVIWEGSLALAEDAPWHGIGPGLFPMVYPQYRLDSDRSAAFFVHNDYLQFLIEAGWPATLLLVAALVSLAVMSFVRVFSKKVTREQRLALVIPLLGLGAIAGHSLLSFNLFLPSLLIMVGVLFGVTTIRLASIKISPEIFSQDRRLPRSIATALTLLGFLPAAFFLDTGRGALLHKEAEALIEKNSFGPAIHTLERAAEASPDADIYHYSIAWLTYRQFAAEGQPLDTQSFKGAMERLSTAEKLNPLRPQIYVIRARILEGAGNPESGMNWKNSEALRNRIEADYQKAVAEDPFHLEGRFYLARFLLQQNRLKEGQAVLEEGIDKPYSYSELSVNYYRLTAEMRRILGDQEGYEALMERLNAALEKEARKKR